MCFLHRESSTKALLTIILLGLFGWASSRGGRLLSTNLESSRHPRCWVGSDVEQCWCNKRKRCAQISPPDSKTASPNEHPMPILEPPIPSVYFWSRIRWRYKFGLLHQKTLTGFMTLKKLLKPSKSQAPHLSNGYNNRTCLMRLLRGWNEIWNLKDYVTHERRQIKASFPDGRGGF